MLHNVDKQTVNILLILHISVTRPVKTAKILIHLTIRLIAGMEDQNLN